MTRSFAEIVKRAGEALAEQAASVDDAGEANDVVDLIQFRTTGHPFRNKGLLRGLLVGGALGAAGGAWRPEGSVLRNVLTGAGVGALGGGYVGGSIGNDADDHYQTFMNFNTQAAKDVLGRIGALSDDSPTELNKAAAQLYEGGTGRVFPAPGLLSNPGGPVVKLFAKPPGGGLSHVEQFRSLPRSVSGLDRFNKSQWLKALGAADAFYLNSEPVTRANSMRALTDESDFNVDVFGLAERYGSPRVNSPYGEGSASNYLLERRPWSQKAPGRAMDDGVSGVYWKHPETAAEWLELENRQKQLSPLNLQKAVKPKPKALGPGDLTHPLWERWFKQSSANPDYDTDDGYVGDGAYIAQMRENTRPARDQGVVIGGGLGAGLGLFAGALSGYEATRTAVQAGLKNPAMFRNALIGAGVGAVGGGALGGVSGNHIDNHYQRLMDGNIADVEDSLRRVGLSTYADEPDDPTFWRRWIEPTIPVRLPRTKRAGFAFANKPRVN